MSRYHPRFLYCYYKKIKSLGKTKPCPNRPFVLQTAATGSRLHRDLLPAITNPPQRHNRNSFKTIQKLPFFFIKSKLR